jgi:hypothetical protein
MPTVPDVYNRRPAANSNLAMLASVADGLVSATNTVPRFVTRSADMRSSRRLSRKYDPTEVARR